MKVYDGFIDEKNETATVVFNNVGLLSQKKLLDAVKFNKELFFTNSIFDSFDDKSIFGCKNKCKSEVDLTNAKVIFQDNTTILIVDDKKYFAKPEKGEKFDAEKGLLVCLMKCAGLSTSDFLDLMKNAKKCGKAVKCDKVKLKKKVK